MGSHNNLGDENKMLKILYNRSNDRQPVPFDCLVKTRMGESKVKAYDKPKYAALLNFPQGIDTVRLTLKSGLYFLKDKIDTGSVVTANTVAEDAGSQPVARGIFVWNPSRKPILPILGIVMAMKESSSLQDKILIFKRKRRIAIKLNQAKEKRKNLSEKKKSNSDLKPGSVKVL